MGGGPKISRFALLRVGEKIPEYLPLVPPLAMRRPRFVRCYIIKLLSLKDSLTGDESVATH